MIIEHRTFRLPSGVAVADFLAADERVQGEVAPFLEGFVRRTTARGADGRWLVETLWWSSEACDAAAHAQHPAVEAFAACVDVDSFEVARWETLD